MMPGGRGVLSSESALRLCHGDLLLLLGFADPHSLLGYSGQAEAGRAVSRGCFKAYTSTSSGSWPRPLPPTPGDWILAGGGSPREGASSANETPCSRGVLTPHFKRDCHPASVGAPALVWEIALHCPKAASSHVGPSDGHEGTCC